MGGRRWEVLGGREGVQVGMGGGAKVWRGEGVQEGSWGGLWWEVLGGSSVEGLWWEGEGGV